MDNDVEKQKGTLRDKLIAEGMTVEQGYRDMVAKRPDVSIGSTKQSVEGYKKSDGTLEKDVLKACIDLLKSHKIWHRRIQVQGAIRWGKGGQGSLTPSTMRGMPDVIAVSRGRFIGIEIKKRGGKLDSVQAETLREIITAGGKACICFNPEKIVLWLSATEWHHKHEGIDVV